MRQFRFPFIFSGDRVIDVGSEWRTFSNDKATKDPSRVGDSQNPLLSDGDLSTMIGNVINPLGRKCQVQTDQRPGVGNFAKLSVTVPSEESLSESKISSKTTGNDGCLIYFFCLKWETNTLKLQTLYLRPLF